ncbi:MAG: patatin-like phospholipase family protein [Salinibacter sp.]
MTTYRNLAFEGAGVRSIAQVGALQGMGAVDGLLDGIRRVAGTSGGSMLALGMALRYSPEEIARLMRDLDFGRVQSGWDPIRLATRYGLYDGNYVSEALASWIERSPLALSADATFRELHSANTEWEEAHRQDARELHVFAANLNTNGTHRFSHACTPDIAVREAVRASMSIPLLFEAVEIDGDIYVDGGAMYTYPVTAFDFDPLPCRTPGTATEDSPESEPDPRTIGFHFAPLLEDNDLGWDSPVHFLTELIETSHQPSYHTIASTPHIRERTITIDTGGIKTTKFDLTDAEKRILWFNGLKATCDFLEIGVPSGATWPSD